MHSDRIVNDYRLCIISAWPGELVQVRVHAARMVGGQAPPHASGSLMRCMRTGLRAIRWRGGGDVRLLIQGGWHGP